jgi:hypothetical protein
VFLCQYSFQWKTLRDLKRTVIAITFLDDKETYTLRCDQTGLDLVQLEVIEELQRSLTETRSLLCLSGGSKVLESLFHQDLEQETEINF